MKRLLLVSLVGLSLVGCSNEVDYNQTEIPVQDTAPTLEEQRNELRRQVENKTPEYKETMKKVSEYTLKYGSPDTSYVFDDGSIIYIWDGVKHFQGVSVLVPAK